MQYFHDSVTLISPSVIIITIQHKINHIMEATIITSSYSILVSITRNNIMCFGHGHLTRNMVSISDLTLLVGQQKDTGER